MIASSSSLSLLTHSFPAACMSLFFLENTNITLPLLGTLHWLFSLHVVFLLQTYIWLCALASSRTLIKYHILAEKPFQTILSKIAHLLPLQSISSPFFWFYFSMTLIFVYLCIVYLHNHNRRNMKAMIFFLPWFTIVSQNMEQ